MENLLEKIKPDLLEMSFQDQNEFLYRLKQVVRENYSQAEKQAHAKYISVKGFREEFEKEMA